VLRGRATAKRIELERGSRVQAELSTPSLVVAEGALLSVRCDVGEEAEPAGGTASTR
jgi:hypothetical protein